MFYPPLVNGLPKERWKSGKALCVTKQMRAKIHYYARKAIGLPGMPTREHAKEVMGIPLDHQMTYAEIGEAVPPPYSKFIAENAIQQLKD
jgi:site-specific DNA-cytosine methylase